MSKTHTHSCTCTRTVAFLCKTMIQHKKISSTSQMCFSTVWTSNWLPSKRFCNIFYERSYHKRKDSFIIYNLGSTQYTGNMTIHNNRRQHNRDIEHSESLRVELKNAQTVLQLVRKHEHNREAITSCCCQPRFTTLPLIGLHLLI